MHHSKQITPPEGLERLFAILLTIRQAAQHYFFNRSEWNEYYTGLIIFLLGSLRYGDLNKIAGAKQSAFWGATAVLNLMENGGECDGAGNGHDAQAHSPPLSILSDNKQGKVLDAGLKKEIGVGVSTVLLVLIRDPNSKGLRVFLNVEPDYGLQEEDVRSSRTFQLDFPVDELGNLLPTDVEIVINAPDFSPLSQSKIIEVDPNKNDDELDPVEFMLTPFVPGKLQIIIEVYQAPEGIRRRVGSKPVHTTSTDTPSPYVKYRVMSLMLHIFGKEPQPNRATFNIYGDMIQGDKVGGDKVGKDKITVPEGSDTIPQIEKPSNATHQEKGEKENISPTHIDNRSGGVYFGKTEDVEIKGDVVSRPAAIKRKPSFMALSPAPYIRAAVILISPAPAKQRKAHRAINQEQCRVIGIHFLHTKLAYIICWCKWGKISLDMWKRWGIRIGCEIISAVLVALATQTCVRQTALKLLNN